MTRSIPKLLLSLTAVLLLTSASFAQDQKPEDHDAKVALIKSVLESAHATRNAQVGMDAVLDGQLHGAEAAITARITADTKLTAEQKQEAKKEALAYLTNRMNLLKGFIQKEIDLNKLVTDTYVTLYDKYFTTEDLKNMLTWYQSPTGQKSLDLIPQIATDGAKLINAVVLPKIQQFAQQMDKPPATPAPAK